MRRHRFTPILVLLLTAALMLTACGNPSPGGQSAPQSSESSGAGETRETAATQISKQSEAGETAEIAAAQATAQTAAEEEASGISDTAAGASPVFSTPCPAIPADQYPTVDGSTATLPLSYALFQAATGEDEETAEETIKHNKTDSSYIQLAYGRCDLVLAYEPSEETRKRMEEEASLEMKPIGRDALVFMVNASNPVKSLTEEQIQAVYSGQTTNWKELGGADEEIVAFQRKQNSGSQTLMEKLVMDGIPMAEAPSHHYISSMGELLDIVSSYNNQGNAIGYSVYFYARNMYSVPGLEFLSVDGITPSNETIQDGSYPYVNEFYAVIRDDEPEDSPARLLFDWLTSEGGQELVSDTGYVPVLDKQSAKGDAAALVTTEKGDTSYDLKEDQVILLDGSHWFNSPGVHVMNADMTERDFIEGCTLTDGQTLVVWSVNNPLVLMDAASDKKGLYDMRAGKWIIEPAYRSITRNSNGDYKCYTYGEPDRIYNGSEILQMENECFCAGDGFYWIKDDTGYSIRKGGKEITGHVDVTWADQGASWIQFGPLNNTVEVNPGTGQECLYTPDGEPIFKPEYLQSEIEDFQDLSYYFSGCTNLKGLICLGFRNDDLTDSLIYDLETGEYTWIEDKNIKIILRNKERDYAFQIKSDSGLSILTDSFEPLKASDGTPYEYCFGMDCCGYRDTESGNIVVENPDGSIHFEMPFHEGESIDYQGTMIARGVILYIDRQNSVYELIDKGDLICSSDSYMPLSIYESPGDYNSINREYTTVNIGGKYYVIQTDTGKLTYQSSEDYLVNSDYPVLVFQSGNWLNFRDPNGGLVMKAFSDRSGGD